MPNASPPDRNATTQALAKRFSTVLAELAPAMPTSEQWCSPANGPRPARSKVQECPPPNGPRPDRSKVEECPPRATKCPARAMNPNDQ
eukprot:2774174-Alexandrium_andersonii.AAC.1